MTEVTAELDPLKYFGDLKKIKAKLLKKVAWQLQHFKKTLSEDDFKDFCAEFRPPLSVEDTDKIIRGDVADISRERAWNLSQAFMISGLEEIFEFKTEPTKEETLEWQRQIDSVSGINRALTEGRGREY